MSVSYLLVVLDADVQKVITQQDMTEYSIALDAEIEEAVNNILDRRAPLEDGTLLSPELFSESIDEALQRPEFREAITKNNALMSFITEGKLPNE